METYKDYKINRYFFLGIILLFAVFLLASLLQFFTAFLSAIIFYVLSTPFTHYLVRRKHWRKSWAAILVIVFSFFIILLPLTLLVSLLYGKISGVISNPAAIISVVKQFDQSLQQQFNFELFSDKNIGEIQSYATNLLSMVLNQSFNFFSEIVMMYFFLYFMITNMTRMEAAIVFYLPFKREKINMFGKELVSQTFSNAVGIPLIAVVQGLFAFACYSITGVKQAAFWGVITAFTSVIPIVGSGIVWLPVSIYLLVTGATWQGIFVIAWSAIIVGSVDNVIRFALAKRMADVHPVVTVLGVIVGLKYFGFIGLIFGPLLISYFLILLRIYYAEYRKKPVLKNESPRRLVPTYMHPLLGPKRSKKR